MKKPVFIQVIIIVLLIGIIILAAVSLLVPKSKLHTNSNINSVQTQQPDTSSSKQAVISSAIDVFSSSSISHNSKTPPKSAGSEDNSVATVTVDEKSVVTKNIMYSFKSTDLIMLKKIEPEIGKAMDFDRMSESGELDAGWSVALTQMTVKNMLSEPQTVMLNNVSISFLINDEPSAGAISMRYFDKGDTSSRGYFKHTLKANEELECTVGFLIDDSWLQYGTPIFTVNPGGTHPLNEDARIIPITLSPIS